MYKLGKLDAVLLRCNIRLSNYVSNVDEQSYCEVVGLLSEGVTDPDRLVKCVHGRTINKWGRDTVKATLTVGASRWNSLQSTGPSASS